MKPKATILIVEDEWGLQDILRAYLERSGFQTVGLDNGRDAFRFLLETPPDLAILDILLPEMDGVAITRELRAQGRDLPIIMLTARTAEADRLRGLSSGADDYVVKPFSPAEVVLRVEAVLRRSQNRAALPASIRAAGPIVLDDARHLVTVHGHPVALTPSEFRLLSVFLRHPGRTFTRQQLLDHIVGEDFMGYDRNVDVHVSKLRKKLRLNPDPIRSVYGVGYRFIVPTGPST